ncbi:MAG: GGDEF domain-containing protein [Myxococcota bacterium]|nr:GGDEF domain-containing protein [Myxococcota bacterium]
MPDDPKNTPRPPSVDGRAPTDRPSTPRASLAEWSDEESSTRTTDSAIAMPPAVSTRQRMRALLTVLGGPATGRVFAVQEDETVLGRSKEAHVRIDDPGASRAHARIVKSGEGKYFLEDLASTNGTFLDGRRVERAELSTGARIHFGASVVFSFSLLDAQAERITHQLYESSVRDPLTRAHNRRYFVERLASEIAHARRHETQLALILFDLDNFKRVNDTYGHLAGDDVLRDVAALVSRMIRAEDVFARYGGEEFVVVVRSIGQPNVSRFAERLRVAIERLEVASEATILRVTISAGHASLHELPEDERRADALLRLADERLYRAKTAGRNRVVGT